MRICLLCFFMLCFSFGFTQESKTDSVHYLKGFEFNADKNQFYANGTKHQLIDSAAKNTFENLTVAELLSRRTPVFIKNYGPGALATPSFRGTSANHTAVVWNGFNLQSPMNGTFDLSLLPAFLIDDIDLSYGGGSALFGSGAIGGIIHIGNRSKFDEGLDAELYSSYSSINDRIIGFKTNYTVKKNTTVLKLYDQNNLNTYQFENYTKPDSPVETQRNAKIKSSAIMLENYWQISSNQKLSIRTWYQNNERQIAPVVFSIYGAAMQKDESLRVSAEWNKWWEKTKISVRAANLSDRLDYEDSLSFIATNSKANSSIIEAEVKHEIKKQHWLELGLHESYIKGQSQGYGKENPIIHKQAVLASYKGTIKKLNVVLNTRQEIFNSKIIPFTFSLAMDYTLLKKLQLTSKISKNYRLPTFNDLYWLPGGNPDLQPEQGWCEEIGANYAFKKNNFNAEIQTTLYNKNITNWIIWLPQFSYWSPQNILQVWSRGFESALTIKQTIKKFSFAVDARYNYALSTNQKTIIENDASINKQLIYVPIYNAQGNVSVYYNRFVFNYNHTYTYYRYTSADNSYFLFPYQLSNISMGYLFRINKAMKAKLSSQVNNCFNTNYEVLIGRPMPLRFYQLSLSIIFTNKNK